MAKVSDSDESPVRGFDETNGLAGNLDGDDGGSNTPEGDLSVSGLLKNALRPEAGRYDDSGESSYSEEGRP